MADQVPLDAELLCHRCDPAALGFVSSDTLPAPQAAFGQARAVEAIRLAIGMDHPCFNLFVLGEPGGGRHALVRGLLEQRAATMPAAGDWCYVYNFAEPTQPRVLNLPAGVGDKLRRDMMRFAEDFEPAIGAALDSEDFRTRAEALQQELKQREANALSELGQEARQRGAALLRTPQGFTFVPLKDDEPMAPDVFAELAEEEKTRIGRLIDEFGERLQKLMHQVPRWRREMHGQLRQLGRDTINLAVGHLIADLKEAYAQQANVLAFLDEVLDDVVEYGESLRVPHDDADSVEFSSDGISVQRYQVNLLVGNEKDAAAPIVFEDSPTYANLIGRVDHIAHMGTMVTNFTLIKAGALHRANGGFLMLDAIKVLSKPYAWEALKRALKSGELRIDSLDRALGFASTLPLEPAPIPLTCRVVLFGEATLYYLLKEYDAEFGDLIRVAADFESDVARNDDNTRQYAAHIADLARRDGLLAIEAAAMARVVEFSSRQAGDGERLATNVRRVATLLHEADRGARAENADRIRADDVDAALAAQIRRQDRLRARYQEAILRETLLIASSGGHIGQINGLAVIDLGDFMFAHPVRITATVRLGEGDVIDIERETELGGAIHSKGVMILSSFLGARYASRMPLSLAASLVFEQSYGPVEGDSASLAELCALLSALAGTPIDQSLAVTGSVNQFGQVQAIGAVNEKIEGFFDICRLRGLTGSQGVLIPHSNVKNLMLRDDVVAAARAGQFRIYAVASVDAAIEILTGVPAGEPDTEGYVPVDSINGLVAAQLTEMSKLRQSFAGGGRRRRREKKEVSPAEAAGPKHRRLR
jgi:lon-related putative ATP-dependent protease